VQFVHFSALTLMVGWQEGYPVRKAWVFLQNRWKKQTQGGTGWFGFIKKKWPLNGRINTG